MFLVVGNGSRLCTMGDTVYSTFMQKETLGQSELELQDSLTELLGYFTMAQSQKVFLCVINVITNGA